MYFRQKIKNAKYTEILNFEKITCMFLRMSHLKTSLLPHLLNETRYYTICTQEKYILSREYGYGTKRVMRNATLTLFYFSNGYCAVMITFHFSLNRKTSLR